ncbi:MAG: hypothetical protein PHY29_10635, partial [Syntrophales bacterium]|nr:hypothetical protein [Syntrophales bacterium]
LEDSTAFRRFSRLPMGQYPSKSILHENIKHITEDAWETIHRATFPLITLKNFTTQLLIVLSYPFSPGGRDRRVGIWGLAAFSAKCAIGRTFVSRPSHP